MIAWFYKTTNLIHHFKNHGYMYGTRLLPECKKRLLLPETKNVKIDY